ncbi:MAG: mandelate racemase/muconate lactonizing enzyme family protein [Eubacteriales bacterium]|nr:mandelate racemase/muconate lactonizing enzyme family protein [Eubacteriales bacterium]
MSKIPTLTPEQRQNLVITDMRFCDIDGMPKRCTLIKIYTNVEGLVGYGEVRDAATKTYAAMCKSRILGENPCNVDKIFRRIKQFGGHSRQGGGVSGIEVALMDLAGKAYGVPCYQLLGGKFRDKIRVYCDTDVEGRHTGHDMGLALKARMEAGFTFLKMDLGIGLLIDEPGTLTAPLGFLEELKTYGKHSVNAPHGSMDYSQMTKKSYEVNTVAHPFTGIHLTEKGLDMLENYVREVRDVIGYDVPLAVDHFGHICVEDCIRFLRRVEKYNLAWVEDLAPWHFTEHYVRLRNSTTVPIATGEDIYLKENFEPLMKAGGVSLIHPDVLTTGGMLETKKIGDMAYDYGVAVALHMAESPIGAMAAVHVGAALPQLMCMEYHSVDVPYWQDVVNGLPRPLIDHGFITVPDAPGLGIESLNEELIEKLVCKNIPGVWEPTDNWDNDICNDRLWS